MGTTGTRYANGGTGVRAYLPYQLSFLLRTVPVVPNVPLYCRTSRPCHPAPVLPPQVLRRRQLLCRHRLYTWRIEPHWLEIVRHRLDIANLPETLVGRTLVQISDLHVGPRVDDGYVADTLRRVADLKPDIVVFTGDFISHSPTVFEQVARVYRHVPIGRLATLAVLGNHDYGPNWAHPEIAKRVVETVTPLGVRFLRNEVADVEGLQIVGLDDWWARAFQPAAAFARLTEPARRRLC